MLKNQANASNSKRKDTELKQWQITAAI